VLLAIAAQNDWRRSRCCSTTSSRAGAAATASAEAETDGTTATDIQSPDVAGAHGGVPRRLELTGLSVDRNAVIDAIVEQDVRVRDTADRAVRIVEYRALVAPIAVIVVAPLVLDRRRSEEHTSELQSRENLVCRLLLEKKK